MPFVRHCIIACSVLIAACTAKDDSGLVTAEVYADRAVYFDPRTVRKTDDTVTLWTIWGPKDASKRFNKGEMRLRMKIECRTGRYLHDDGAIFVRGKRQEMRTKFKRISGSVPSPDYVKVIKSHVC